MAEPSITVTLTGEAAEKLSKLVAAGLFDSAEAAIEVAIDALGVGDETDIQYDAELEHWLRTEVVGRFESAKSESSRLLTSDEVRRSLFGKP